MKLSNNDVQEIKFISACGISGMQIAEAYGVSRGLITAILRGFRRQLGGGLSQL